VTRPELRIALSGGRSVAGRWTEVAAAATAFVYAPGAGSNLNDPFGAYAAATLAEHGIATLRFQFPYSEAGRPLPDRPPLLEETWRAAIAVARQRAPRLVVGGRSMGGRIASQVVAAGETVSGLALFAYPLHPAGRREPRRDAHLPSIGVPTLFCSGDRDSFASVAELQALAALMPRARLHLLAGAASSWATTPVAPTSGRPIA
jgi:predicted alpha/beta-hydrolase family hydrolase